MKTASRLSRIRKAYQAGDITQETAITQLEELKIRGGFNEAESFIGYDYNNQQWIEFPRTFRIQGVPTVGNC